MKNLINDFIISTEATCDLSEQAIKELNVKVMDMAYFVDETQYSQLKSDLPLKDFYAKMKEGAKTSTSMINEMEAEEFFTELLKAGKDILHIAFSSGLSGTCDCIRRVAERLNGQNENKIYVVDSKCGSLGEGLIVDYAVNLKNDGKSLTEVMEILTDAVEKTNAFFTVQNLKYLARGGRISKSAALIGNVAMIKPVLFANEKGAVVQGIKCIGEKKAFLTLLEKIKQKYTELYNKIYVSHADCEEHAKKLIEKIKTHFPKATVSLGEIGPVMGSHCGPGTIAVFFFGKSRCF